MYKNEKELKVTSILLIIYGGFDILQFLLMLVLVVAMKLNHAISANGILLVLVALTATFNSIMVLACLQFASKVVQGQSIWDIQQN